MVIRKFPGKNKFGLYSKETHKRLGIFSSRMKAVKREKEIQFFKHVKGAK